MITALPLQVVSRGFNPDFGLFVSTSPEGLIYPRPSADKVDQGTQLLEFLGKSPLCSKHMFTGAHRPKAALTGTGRMWGASPRGARNESHFRPVS